MRSIAATVLALIVCGLLADALVCGKTCAGLGHDDSHAPRGPALSACCSTVAAVELPDTPHLERPPRPVPFRLAPSPIYSLDIRPSLDHPPRFGSVSLV